MTAFVLLGHIFVCTVYIYYVYIYILFFISIFIYTCIFFICTFNIYMYACVYLYIHNKYTQYTHIVCKQTFILNAINRFATLLTLVAFSRVKMRNMITKP